MDEKNQENCRVLYDIDDGIIKKCRDNPPRLQLPNDVTSITNNIIPQNENYASTNENNIPISKESK